MKKIILLLLLLVMYSCNKAKFGPKPQCKCGTITKISDPITGPYDRRWYFSIKLECVDSTVLRTFSVRYFGDGATWKETYPPYSIGDYYCFDH